mmetsp:Transcript_1438/g.2706  ORF Transcript_1438/g.2706 Transcript_1438/m.2706 type:complete len:1056 (-) Transcript_1438:1640-4807(-)
MGWIRAFVRIGRESDDVVVSSAYGDSNSLGPLLNHDDNLKRNNSFSFPGDEMEFGYEEIVVTLVLLVISYIVLSTPISTGAGVSTQFGSRLGSAMGRSMRRIILAAKLHEWWPGENYCNDDVDMTPKKGNRQSCSIDRKHLKTLLGKNKFGSDFGEDFASDMTVRARGSARGDCLVHLNEKNSRPIGEEPMNGSQLSSLFRPVQTTERFHASASDGILSRDYSPERIKSSKEGSKGRHEFLSTDSCDEDDTRSETDHYRFEVAWKSHIRFSEYKALVLPPDCKLLDSAQRKIFKEKTTLAEFTLRHTTIACAQTCWRFVAKLLSVDGTKQFTSASIGWSKELLLWLMNLFRYILRKSRGLPIDEDDDEEDDDGSVASLGSATWSILQKTSCSHPTNTDIDTQKRMDRDAAIITDAKDENVENIPPCDVVQQNVPAKTEKFLEKDEIDSKSRCVVHTCHDKLECEMDLSAISMPSIPHRQLDGRNVGKTAYCSKYTNMDTNDDATFVSAKWRGDSISSSLTTNNTPSTVASQAKILSLQQHDKDLTSNDVSQKMDRLEKNRNPELPDTQLEFVSPMPSPKIKPQIQEDDTPKMKFFDTANSNRQLLDLSREVPLPDSNGYILGDEFLESSSFTPMLVFVNSRSGPQQGELLISQFRRLLNPIQVWDLANGGPEKILLSFSVFSRLQLLICGGDGTVSWIISVIEKLDLKRWPPIAILPLGTGNDLARIHGWGGGYNNESLLYILRQVSEAYVSLLDLWELDITEKKGKRKAVKSFMNYLGVGVDAQAALQVHMLRESKPSLFFSRFFNKAWYAIAGGEEALKSSCANLSQHISLVADGRDITIPQDSQGIIFLNIDSYSGGVPLWSNGYRQRKWRRNRCYSEGNLTNHRRGAKGSHFPQSDCIEHFHNYYGAEDRSCDAKIPKPNSCNSPSSCQDGFLDVVSIRGTFHLGQIRVGLSNAQLLCQCREATVTLRKKVAVQIDGEPWRQNPSNLRIVRKRNRAVMLNRSVDNNGGMEAEVLKLLTWASEKDIIDQNQYSLLMEEFSRRIEQRKWHSQE